ncbi:glycosyltransferase family 2 protein [Hyphobacterium sp. HN65]|uniref:Glycosyltransferase family 2 protein n=1 Tax=Hyphobacterium lacteum TaxID=3116575 RepID=A0ABU7LPQ8_9PROT|nr:glycosyltransferase family 2 protein [Hyphobacterium sp. HN65]MEE2525882.1 glycosyltransferase family 2 protein [Hyphobacterium sp. HN65]
MAVETNNQNSEALVDIVVVNYNGRRFLSKCLKSLSLQTESRFRAFIIDNASNDHVDEYLLPPDERFIIIKNQQNLGFAVACNQGAKLGNAPWIAMLNPDAVPEKNWLEKTIRFAEQTHSAMVGCKQISLSNPTQLDGVGDVYSPWGLAWRGGYGWDCSTHIGSGEVFGPCAAAALYSRDAYILAGGFDEDFFCYMEDVDLAFRLRIQGFKAVQCNDAIVHHFGSGISGPRSEFTIYHGTRNRIWTWAKNAPPILFWLGAPVHATANIAFLLRSLFHGRFMITGKAIIDALGDFPRILRKRKEIQSNRKCRTIKILRSMNFSLVDLIRRAPDIRPLKNQPSRSGDENAQHRE